MTTRAWHLSTMAALLLSARSPARLSAQGSSTASGDAAWASVEARLLAVPDTANARAMTRDLSASPHVAGTPAQAQTRDYTIAKMRSWGLETWIKTYTVHMPHPDTVGVWYAPLPSRKLRPLSLAEPRVLSNLLPPGDQVPPFNAYTGDGDVTSDAVYVNYGLSKDYDTLDSLGVSVEGKIAIARYGRSFRGIKVREAERHGAIGLILYSDPQEDGYVRADVYPAGPMRPADGIQRGSILIANGDPTTPGYASVAEAHRVPEESLTVPHIPTVPMGYGNARRILAPLGGTAAPAGWQGGLSFHYHIGPGPTRVRLKVTTEHGLRALHPIWNTFGMIRGTTYPDEWVVIGAHRDAWSPGAADNVSGTVTVLEAARAFGQLARRGIRPARTVIFVTWDAEEWGLIGSTEWVEELEDTVGARVVAYINEDDVTTGTRFVGAASLSLKPFLRDLTRAVPDPEGRGSVYDAWQAGLPPGDTSSLPLDNLGGGSDFAAFTHHLGIASLGAGFEGPDGIYHSMYDSYDWMSRFGDPGYRAHRAIAQLVTLAAARLANAVILPLDYVAFGTDLGAFAARLDSVIAERHWGGEVGLKSALEQLTAAARVFATVRDSALAGGLDPARAARVNHWLMQVERRFTRPQGLAGRPWYRSLQFASDMDNGYSTMVFPSVNEGIRHGDAPAVARELADLVTHVDLARQAIEQATAALR